ncbi:MAG: fibro-slime domain-containing protein [Clostridiales bacterium]|nr:fibro-slime domain-containing protein [Clostridiales bacterium]
MLKRRFLIFTLALMLVLSLLPASAVAAGKENVTLYVTIRDFKADGLLFEGNVTSNEGMVQSHLGTEKKPVFNLPLWKELYENGYWEEEQWVMTGPAVTQTMLDALYNDVPGVNMRAKKTITLADDRGYYVMDSAVDEMGGNSDGFFPIDNELFGNYEDYDHNFHFSTELHATFQYKTGDEFWFIGDDDVWVFFNDTLCVDLGGVHGATDAYVSIDALVAEGKLTIKPGDYVSLDMFHMERCTSESNFYMKTNINFVNFNNSDWATQTLFEAYQNGLIPEILMKEDLTLPVYRDEFAAMAVKLYEALTGTIVPEADTKANPFTDTDDPDVLKAYALGIVNGTSATTYGPRVKLTREQAATMLTRVYKAATIEDWTLESDSQFPLTYTNPPRFADDSQISSWAKDSVYFMTAHGVITGVGENRFAPVGIDATKEQALIISGRAFMKLPR